MQNNNDQSVTITGEEYQAGPSLEESFEALKTEGIVSEDADGALTDPNEGAQGGAKEGDADQGSNEDRPDWLPSKFQSPEDLAKAYDELQKKLSSGKPDEDPEETSEGDAPEETQKASEEEIKAAEEATKKAGLDLNVIQQEWNAEGTLKDETYEALEKAGYPRDMVDTYIDGLTARSGDVVMTAHEIVGGEDQYSEMIDWAVSNLSEDDQKAFDKAVTSGDKNSVSMAVKALKADWQAAVAKDASEEPEETIEANGKVQGNAYQTLDDYLEDLNDPRYDTNESFRNKVAQKLARSSIM